MVFLGGALPPPVLEVSVTDRAFVPHTAKLKHAGQAIRFKATGTINHELLVAGSISSPLLRPGASWILDTSQDAMFAKGSVDIVCEVTRLKMSVVVLEGAEWPTQARDEEEEEEENKNMANVTAEEEEEEAEEDANPGVDDEMLEALRRKVGLMPKVHAVASPSIAWGVAGDDDQEEDDDEAAYRAERERHGAIARGRVSP